MADVSERTIESGVADLQSKGILMREGGRKDGRWVVIKKHDEQGFEISLERNKFTFVEKVFSHSIINYNTTMNTKRYTWIPFYKEFAQKLMKFRNDRASLLKLIYENREEFIAGHLHDVKGYGNLLKDIDPFTVFGLFNRQLTNVNKINSIRLFKELFNMESDVPSDFAGVPVLNNMNSLFFGFKGKRGKNDIENIWILFEKVLNGEDFEEDFNAVRSQFAVNNKLSMALFWIRPEEYIALDKKNRAFLWENFEIEIPDSPSFSQYQQLIIDIRNMMKTGVIKQKSFVELSSAADNEAGTDEEESMAVDSDESMNARMAKCVDLWETRKNIVLQGAPGTGKTYRVPELVVRLCSPEFDADRATRDELMEEYDKLKNDRRVMFTTFHQSMDYEDWLEGLRPVVDDGNQVTYRPEPGIFKQLCDEAEKPVSVNKGIDISRDATVWKVSLKGAGDNPVRTDCMKNGYIRIGWDYLGKDITEETDYGVGGGKIPLNAFINTMKTGDVVLSCYSNSIIDAIGVVTGDYEWHEEFKEYKRLRKVQWLVKGIHEDIVALNDGKTMTLSTVYRMNAMNIGDIKMLLDKHEKSESLIANTNPYVVVVDEINRGNVAKIFGELITLLEPDKRKGMKDAECVTLPYSKKPFCVPSNVYLIATMNTADRSLGAVDYAVRRRFAFVSVLPYEIDDENFHHDLFRRVSELFISNYDEYADSGFDVNVKLEPADTLCDEYRPEDVWIGHSYFIMKDEDEVRNRMEFEILPLLQEYVRDGVLTYEAQEKIDDLFQEYVVA